MKKLIQSGIWLSLVLAMAACSNSEDALVTGGGSGGQGAADTASGPQLQFKMSSIERLEGQHYEGWVIGAGGVFTTGRFNMNENGDVVAVDVAGDVTEVLSQTDTAVFSYDEAVGDLSLFVLTIEPNNDSDPSPSAVHYVGGAFTDGVAVANVDHGSAIGASFLSSAGSYMLATPTNGPSTHNQGVWFLDPSGPAPSLSLPALNTGWAYEGWVVNRQTGEVVSTGVFDSASGQDSDGAGATAGSGAFPPFPGQDFINPARILNNGNYTVVVSIEPSPDFDPRPFTLKILADDVANGAAVTTSLGLANISNEQDISIVVTDL